MAKPKFGVIIFPGTNCNIETFRAIELAGLSPVYLWHEDRVKNGDDFAGFVLPGGFSYGDYLKAGKIASFSPIIESLKEILEKKDVPVIGICNGFQILCESGILPGTLLQNSGIKFVSKWVEIEVIDNETPFTCGLKKGEKLKMLVAHKFGNYFYRDEKPNVVFRYVENPNGSKDDIAGICSDRKNVVGLMPHPERAVEKILGSEDGMKIFLSLKKWLS